MFAGTARAPAASKWSLEGSRVSWRWLKVPTRRPDTATEAKVPTLDPVRTFRVFIPLLMDGEIAHAPEN